MRLLVFCLVAVFLTSCLVLSGCWGCGLKQDPDQLRKSTAERTAQAKTDATAIAQGIREGLARDDRIDLNTATNKELETLPGVTPALAAKIVRNRPYDKPQQLVTKQVLSQHQYDNISSRVKAKK